MSFVSLTIPLKHTVFTPGTISTQTNISLEAADPLVFISRFVQAYMKKKTSPYFIAKKLVTISKGMGFHL